MRACRITRSAGSDHVMVRLRPRRYQQTSPRSHYYLHRQLQTNNSFIGSVGPNLTKITPRSPIHPQRIPQKYHTKYHTIVPQAIRPHGKCWSVPTKNVCETPMVFTCSSPREKNNSSPLYYTVYNIFNLKSTASSTASFRASRHKETWTSFRTSRLRLSQVTWSKEFRTSWLELRLSLQLVPYNLQLQQLS